VPLGPGQRASPGASARFDVRVTAISGSGVRAAGKLQEVLGIDAQQAEQLLAAVPTVVRRAASAADAKRYSDALRQIGATVIVEPSGNAPLPPSTKVPGREAARRAAPGASPAKTPRRLAPSADLEFDLLTDTPSAKSDSFLGASPPTAAGTSAKRKPRERVIDFGADDAGRDAESSELAFDMSGADNAAHEPGVAPANDYLDVMPRVGLVAEAVANEHARERARRDIAAARAKVETTPQTWSLLRILGAVLVFAAGFWLESTVVHGTASWPSLVAHAVAIYHLGIGLRGATE
jgi:hypothetical protein